MSALSAVLCDLWGNPLRLLSQFEGLQVTDPLNDSRTASLSISVYDPAAGDVAVLTTALKVIYGDVLIFHGIVLQARTDFGAGQVQISAHDPTIKLKHHYHRFGDQAVDEGYPLDGLGLRVLIESSVPIEPQLDRDVPGNHILWGLDETTHQGPRPTTSPPADGDGIWGRVVRGAEVWESVVKASQAIIGPDFRFRPVDAEHPGAQGVPPPGFMVEFDTYDRLSTDRSEEVAFEQGFGQDNAELTHEPDGDSVRNYYVAFFPGGPRSREDGARKALAHNEAAWLDYGIYEGVESTGEKDTQELLQKKANAWVKAYSRPPDFLSVAPRLDRPGVPRYAHEYFVGDLISARARLGYRGMNVVGRIISATTSQSDAAGNTQTSLEVVPYIPDDPAEGTDEDDG